MQKLINFWYGKMEGPYAHYLGHFMAGFMICTIIGHFFGGCVGLIAGVIAAVAKEIMDRRTGKGTPEELAALITAAGALLAYGIVIL